MAERAQVTSVDAIQSFRASLILYLNKARPALEEVTSDVIRTRLWLENDQRRYWETELRKRQRKLERTQAELFSSMLSQLQDASTAQQMAVRHAQRDLRHAEEKISKLKKWERDLEGGTAPLVKQI